MLFKSLALVSLLLTVLILPRIADILPNIGASLLWWKENINVDTNIRLRRDRDIGIDIYVFFPPEQTCPDVGENICNAWQNQYCQKQ